MNIRKSNRLAGYDYSQPGAYFITVCVKDKYPILGAIVGADAHIGPCVKLSRIVQVVEKYLRRIPGIGPYVIMPNHVHFIVHISAESFLEGPMWASAPTNTNVPQMIRSWKILIGKELSQSIWQRSYYDHIIRDEKDYWIKVRYMQENPAKWFFDDYYIP